MFIATLFEITRNNRETTQMSLNWRIDKENVVHLHNEILLSGKIQWHPEIWMQTDGTRKKVMSEDTQTQKDEHGIYFFISVY